MGWLRSSGYGKGVGETAASENSSKMIEGGTQDPGRPTAMISDECTSRFAAQQVSHGYETEILNNSPPSGPRTWALASLWVSSPISATHLPQLLSVLEKGTSADKGAILSYARGEAVPFSICIHLFHECPCFSRGH